MVCFGAFVCALLTPQLTDLYHRFISLTLKQSVNPSEAALVDAAFDKDPGFESSRLSCKMLNPSLPGMLRAETPTPNPPMLRAVRVGMDDSELRPYFW